MGLKLIAAAFSDRDGVPPGEASGDLKLFVQRCPDVEVAGQDEDGSISGSPSPVVVAQIQPRQQAGQLRHREFDGGTKQRGRSLLGDQTAALP